MCRILCAVLAIGCTYLGAVEAQELEPSRIAIAVPFAMASDSLVVVEGRAGNVGGLKFIVDTGATRSVIDKKVASRLQ